MTFDCHSLQLPICDVLDNLAETLQRCQEAIIEAPPGAGKTTLIPLSLKDKNWLQGQRMIMLEPRRMATRAAAERMANMLGEKVGETVGYRVRQQSKISDKTRIEVITEGILTRMLQDDPALEGVGLLIFDEFHERSLDADLGLALALEGRELFRGPDQPLKILLMSATLNGAALQQLLPEAAVLRSEGRMFPVEICYQQAARFDDDSVARVVSCLRKALAETEGNILAFLPGQGEIRRAQEQLAQQFSQDANVQIHALYGALSLQEQQAAIAAPPAGQRKIVLATDIAETSLTIEGITVVVDSGLHRQPDFDLNTGMTRLQTRRISQDSATQRSGRAGRLSAGRCYRLWSEEQQGQLEAFRSPEIQSAELAPLLLQLLAWGIDDIHDLVWLDPPSQAAIAQGMDLLQMLEAISPRAETSAEPHLIGQWQLTTEGEQLAKLPTHPRLGHMLLQSQQHHLETLGSALAAILADRNPFGRESADLTHPLQQLLQTDKSRGQHRHWQQRTQQQSQQFKRLLNQNKTHPNNKVKPKTSATDLHLAGLLLAYAYPERIARLQQAATGEYRLADGQRAVIDPGDDLLAHPWLVVAELGAKQRQGSHSKLRIFSALPFDPDWLEGPLASLTRLQEYFEWDEQRERFNAEERLMLGKLVLSKQPITQPSAAMVEQALLQQIRRRGLQLLPWTPELRQWQARVQLLHLLAAEQHINEEQQADTEQQKTSQWPDVSDQALLDTLEQWLSPYLQGVNKLGALQKLALKDIVQGLLPWPLPKTLEELCPSHIKVPSGSRIAIDYCQQPPVLAVKLQEMFGCTETPTVAKGKVPLMLHLLSPARRPLQLTQDLAGFWSGSYFDVQKEMKGRYPKHPWPDNPGSAEATRYTKKHVVKQD